MKKKSYWCSMSARDEAPEAGAAALRSCGNVQVDPVGGEGPALVEDLDLGRQFSRLKFQQHSEHRDFSACSNCEQVFMMTIHATAARR